MEYRPDVWFSPYKVLVRYAEKEKEIGDTINTASEHKILREARIAAISLLGIQKIQDREYWLQLVDPREGSPDIRTATQLVEIDNSLQRIDVEVVTLGSHSDEQIDDFLKRTKLSATKAYDEKTTILCFIDKNLVSKPLELVSQALSSVKAINDVFVLGRTDPSDWNYFQIRIHPTLDHTVHFNVREEVERPARHTMRFVKGIKRKEWRDESEKHYPF